MDTKTNHLLYEHSSSNCMTNHGNGQVKHSGVIFPTALQRCLLDRDCAGELICLYGHSLPSLLLYISPSHPNAYTCGKLNGDMLALKFHPIYPVF